ncbi:MAG: hypothetical protein GQ527_06665 [Bacteroidales bacterium]|nr:hypothetical protein [Bacteroidales bacterium]
MNNYNIEHTKGEKDQSDQLTFSGELSFSFIQSIKDETDGILNINQAYRILVKEVDILDLSFIQLLLSIKQTHTNSTIELQVNEEISDLIKISGFQNFLV